MITFTCYSWGYMLLSTQTWLDPIDINELYILWSNPDQFVWIKDIHLLEGWIFWDVLITQSKFQLGKRKGNSRQYL